ncbi:hypothetical protein ABL78_4379 [Leptomonas seymouri]|uniref:Uncharacterized protein n=1 Tax=Leptomonas seymouri TaxID=5684 RepID=A0A0N0P5J9_LEPSE|nr:hypothetical protein ABL78_4379 [Leptomonas seymouri]|eukprot:KPI86556.1 hypothetical protein ABL78_4379 [Leptomonas seymouri]
MSIAVTPPTQATCSNGEVVSPTPAARAMSLQQSLVQDYAHARKQYRQAHAQYSARVKPARPSRFDQYCTGAFQDLFFYTSASNPETCCAPSRCTHHPRKAGLHELNYHLQFRARARLYRAPSRRTCTGNDVFALLVTQEAAELADLLELEAVEFKELAYSYYGCVFGPADGIMEEESRVRRQLEDEFNESIMELLKDIRERIWQAEQCLYLRVYGMCPELLPRQPQLAAAALAAEAELYKLDIKCELDCKDAVSLWHRTCVIRGETESEEEISFRRIRLACFVEAHAIEEGYLIRDAATGHLQRTKKLVPAYMQDSVDYSLQFERLALVWSEETDRMALLDATEAAWAAQLNP